MPTITKITEQRRRPNRRNIHLDGAVAFGVNLNVVARFRLREGMSLTPEQVADIERGEVRQEAFDKATEYLGRRMHSRAELHKKLMAREYGQRIVEDVLNELVAATPTPESYAAAARLWTIVGDRTRAEALRSDARTRFRGDPSLALLGKDARR